MTVKLTKTKVDNIPHPESGQVFYRDSVLIGFGVRVGKSVKTYYAEKRVDGKTVRVTIGIHGQVTAEQARRKAQELLGNMAMGQNPVDKKKQEKAESVTLREVFEEYLKARKALKPSTLYDYGYIMENYFAAWLNLPIVNITKDMVAKHHTKLGKSRGEARANYGMRVLRALFNFAMAQYEDSKGQPIISENPVRRLSQTRAWYRVERRQTVIKSHELAAFFKGLNQLKDTATTTKAEVVRDYILLLLFTGLRRQEAASLRWEQVDFKARTLTVTDTKNREPLTLPLSDYLLDMFKLRYEIRVNEYVFPGDGAKGYVVSPRRQMANVTKFSGVTFTLHDLRRTFITIAESLDISSYAVKRLVNHKMTGDVTAGYIIADVERLRKPMQQITNYILTVAGVKPKAEVIELSRKERTIGN